MTKSDRRLSVRLGDDEVELIERIRKAQPHLSKTDVVHLMFADKRETVAAVLGTVPASTRAPVRLDETALRTLDGVAEGLNDVGGSLRPMRALANQMARASNSGDPLVAGALAQLAGSVQGCLTQLADIAQQVGEGSSWRS